MIRARTAASYLICLSLIRKIIGGEVALAESNQCLRLADQTRDANREATTEYYGMVQGCVETSGRVAFQMPPKRAKGGWVP